MEKPFELKALGEKIKEHAAKDGLQLAEQAAEKLAKAAYLGLKDWTKESATLTENKIDDIVAPVIDYLDPMVLPQIEKIDLDGDGQ